MDQKTLNLNDYYYSQQQIDAKLSATQIPAQSDLNTYTTPGKYYCATKANGQTMTNSPWEEGTGYAFSLIVLKHGSGGIRQILFGNTSSSALGADIWTRNLNTSQGVDTWGTWFKIYGTNNIENIITADNLAANNIVTSDSLIAQINQQLNAIIIEADDDLNDYKTPGKYYCASKADGKTIQNSPWEGNDYGYAFGLEIIKTASNGIKQIISSNVSSSAVGADIWTRNYNLSSGEPQWGEWYKIYGNNNLNVDDFVTVNNMTSTHNIVTSNNLNNLLNTYLTNNRYLSSNAISHHGGILITAENNDSSAPKVIQTTAKLGQSKIGWSNEATNILNPIDQGSLPDFSTNRLAFLDPDCVRIMESKETIVDGVAQDLWRDYDFRTTEEITQDITLTQDVINKRKIEIISGRRTLYGGGPKKSHSESDYVGPTNWNEHKKLRIIISAKKGGVYQCYAHLRKMYIHFNNNLSTGCKVAVKVYKAGEYTDPQNQTGEIYPDDTDGTATIDTYELSGGAGASNWHSIPFLSYRKKQEETNGPYLLDTISSRLTGIVFGNYDKNIGKNMSEVHYDKIVLTFSATGYTTGDSGDVRMFSVSRIRFIGTQMYTSPSVMADTGHLYNYDGDQNAIFPAQVSATSFKVPGQSPSGLLKSNGTVDTNSYAQKGQWSPIGSGSPTSEQAGYQLYVNPDLKLAQIYVTYTAQQTFNSNGRLDILNITNHNIGTPHIIALSCNHQSANITILTTDDPKNVVVRLNGPITEGDKIQGYALWYYTDINT
ncbi:MAG: hypothetical protein IKF82_00070 [Bacilli bacterium]|nr:hypothetical protein [Bacilli bacterium]